MNSDIIKGLLAKQENEIIDIKEKYYSKDKKYDLIKDIVSFANNIKPIDKYIVFGVKDTSWNVCGIDVSTLPDISEINDLLRKYVEPFINVEIGSLEYENVTIGYIRIPFKELDRPYIICKEYNKNNKALLREGDIYIRKSGTNFIADRKDLDEIYNNKGLLEIIPYKKIVNVYFASFNNCRRLTGSIRSIISNTLPITANIDSIKIVINSGNNAIAPEVLFIDDEKRVFGNKPELISQKPIELNTGTRMQKTLYFSLSENAVKNLLMKKQANQNFTLSYKYSDVDDKEYESEVFNVVLEFSDDILK